MLGLVSKSIHSLRYESEADMLIDQLGHTRGDVILCKAEDTLWRYLGIPTFSISDYELLNGGGGGGGAGKWIAKAGNDTVEINHDDVLEFEGVDGSLVFIDDDKLKFKSPDSLFELILFHVDEGFDIPSVGGIGFKITIPSGEKYIADHAFEDRSDVAEFDLPNSLVEIGDFAFSKCNWKNVDLSHITNLKIIRKDAFKQSGIETVIFPDNLEKIEDFAFTGNVGIKNITFPPSIKSIGTNCFGSSSMDTITFDGCVIPILGSFTKNLSAVNFINGAYVEEYIKSGTPSFQNFSFHNSLITNLVLPEGTRIINDGEITGLPRSGLCYNCSQLASVTFPSTIEYIGAGSFLDCPLLTAVSVPTGCVVHADAFDPGVTITYV